MGRGQVGFRGSCSAVVVSAGGELGSEIAMGWCPSQITVPHISPHALLTGILQVTFTLQAEGQHVVQTGGLVVWQLSQRPQQAVVVVPMQLCFLIQH